MTQHTPGPWSIDGHPGNGFYIMAMSPTGNRYAVARAYGVRGSYTQGDQASNARLIAAAPELLAAAKQLHDDDYSVAEAAWVALRAAIAKAEGRDS